MVSRVVVVPYDPDWPRRFEALRDRIRPAVEDVALAIEHVGSTAVPGLAAKPVIDIDVVVPRSAVADGIRLLAASGYEPRGDLGIPDREAFRAPAGLPRHHLYLCPADSLALANHLTVRDHLRSHPDDVRAYGELKTRLAARFAEDMDAYVEGKSAFLLDVLRRCSFDETALTGIERMNRRD
ncbi:MAG TPA: GrpB family protein [Longimicrobiales bacterium]|nr:GrpB family protein [Longimicrobiales bacterium]